MYDREKQSGVPSCHVPGRQQAYPIAPESSLQVLCRAQHPFDLTPPKISRVDSTNSEKEKLTKGVNAPNHTLYENLVFVESDEGTKSGRVEEIEHYTRAWSIAFEHFALDERFAGIRSKFLPDIRLSLAECEGLWLSEEVGKKDPMVLAASDGIVRVGRRNEIRGNDLCTLVNELVE